MQYTGGLKEPIRKKIELRFVMDLNEAMSLDIKMKPNSLEPNLPFILKSQPMTTTKKTYLHILHNSLYYLNPSLKNQIKIPWDPKIWEDNPSLTQTHSLCQVRPYKML